MLLLAFPLGALVDLLGPIPTFTASGGVLALLLGSLWRLQRGSALQEVLGRSIS
ncbi:MAG: hypothetical protein QN122_06855 [Armatimonadota bacterium]|nr:hypothetical protein [Armatimonadota bacterium]MDR7491155.1 hypothetical protein [Armatimonadota bacterium]MDR7573776.1 hypothetical protein [Armatimonadota bacterium]